MDVKKCAACGVEKPLTAYSKRSSGISRRGTCRSCMRKRQRETAHSRTGGSVEPAIEPAVTVKTTIKEQAPSVAAVKAVIWPDQPDKKKISYPAEPQMQALQLETGDGASAAEEDAPPQKRKRRKRGRRKSGGHKGTETIASAGPDRAADGRMKAAERADSAAVGVTHADPAPVSLTSVNGSSQVQVLGKESIFSALPIIEAHPAPTAVDELAPKRKRRPRGRKRRRRSAKAGESANSPQAELRPPSKRIVPFKGPFKYDTSILNDRGTGLIRLRGRRETGKRWSTDIPLEMAITMVKEGAAGIISPGQIHKLYSKTDFRLLVLQRDNYVCRYCGRYGDTIDHVMPKSKGGLSSPLNCVCACADCNLKKADSLDFVYDDF